MLEIWLIHWQKATWLLYSASGEKSRILIWFATKILESQKASALYVTRISGRQFWPLTTSTAWRHGIKNGTFLLRNCPFPTRIKAMQTSRSSWSCRRVQSPQGQLLVDWLTINYFREFLRLFFATLQSFEKTSEFTPKIRFMMTWTRRQRGWNWTE